MGNPKAPWSYSREASRGIPALLPPLDTDRGVSTPSSNPAVVPAEDDPDTAFLRSLAPSDAPGRKRVFTSLLRQIVNDKGGQR